MQLAWHAWTFLHHFLIPTLFLVLLFITQIPQFSCSKTAEPARPSEEASSGSEGKSDDLPGKLASPLLDEVPQQKGGEEEGFSKKPSILSSSSTREKRSGKKGVLFPWRHIFESKRSASDSTDEGIRHRKKRRRNQRQQNKDRFLLEDDSAFMDSMLEEVLSETSEENAGDDNEQYFRFEFEQIDASPLLPVKKPRSEATSLLKKKSSPESRTLLPSGHFENSKSRATKMSALKPRAPSESDCEFDCDAYDDDNLQGEDEDDNEDPPWRYKEKPKGPRARRFLTTSQDKNHRKRELPVTYRLHDDLMRHYRKAVRPVAHPSKIVSVTMSVFLYQIIKLDAVKNTISLSGSFELYWQDEFLQWSPEDYEGATEIFLPPGDIWIPEFSLYYSVNFNDAVKLQSNNDVRVNYTGHTRYYVPFSTESLCNSVDVKFFPFDIQGCTLLFGSWSHSNDSVRYALHTKNLSLIDFYDNQEWQLDLSRSTITSDGFLYDYLDPPLYWDMIVMDLVVSRQSFYYVFNLVIPSGIITLVAVIGFHTPGTSGRVRDGKYRLGIMTLMSMSMILIAIVEDMPKFSVSSNRKGRGSHSGIPLIGLYYFVLLTIVSLSTVTSSLFVFVERNVRIYGKIPWYLRFMMLLERERKRRASLRRSARTRSRMLISLGADPRSLTRTESIELKRSAKVTASTVAASVHHTAAASNANGFVNGKHRRVAASSRLPSIYDNTIVESADEAFSSAESTDSDDSWSEERLSKRRDQEVLRVQGVAAGLLRLIAGPDPTLSKKLQAKQHPTLISRSRASTMPSNDATQRHLQQTQSSSVAMRNPPQQQQKARRRRSQGLAKVGADSVLWDSSWPLTCGVDSAVNAIDLLQFPAIDDPNAGSNNSPASGRSGGGAGPSANTQNATPQDGGPSAGIGQSSFSADPAANNSSNNNTKRRRSHFLQQYENAVFFQCLQRALGQLVAGISGIERQVHGIRQEVTKMVPPAQDSEGDWQRAIRRLELLSLFFYISMLILTFVLFFHHDWYCSVGHNPCGQPNLKCPWLPKLDPASPACAT